MDPFDHRKMLGQDATPESTTQAGNHTFVDVRRVSLLSRLVALLFVARGRCSLLASLLLLGGGFACWGFAASGGLLLSGLGRHFE